MICPINVSLLRCATPFISLLFCKSTFSQSHLLLLNLFPFHNLPTSSVLEWLHYVSNLSGWILYPFNGPCLLQCIWLLLVITLIYISACQVHDLTVAVAKQPPADIRPCGNSPTFVCYGVIFYNAGTVFRVSIAKFRWSTSHLVFHALLKMVCFLIFPKLEVAFQHWFVFPLTQCFEFSSMNDLCYFFFSSFTLCQITAYLWGWAFHSVLMVSFVLTVLNKSSVQIVN